MTDRTDRYDVDGLERYQRWPLLPDGVLAPLWILAGRRGTGRTHAARAWARRHDRAVVFTATAERVPGRHSRELSLPPRTDPLQGMMFDLLVIDGMERHADVAVLARLSDLVAARGARTMVTCLPEDLPHVAFTLGLARWRDLPVISHAPDFGNPHLPGHVVDAMRARMAPDAVEGDFPAAGGA